MLERFAVLSLIDRTAHLWRVATLGLVLAVCTHTSSVQAANLTWRSPEITLAVQNLPLADLLHDIASSEGLRASVDPAITGRVSLDFRGAPAQLLDRLETNHGVQWYYDGSIIYFTRTDQRATAVLRLTPPTTTASFETMLSRLEIADRRFPLRTDPVARTVIANGPPRYIELLRHAAQANSPQKSANEEEVRVFMLRYGWAKDRTVQMGKDQVEMPGVASLMRAVFQGSTSAATPNTAREGAGRGKKMDAPGGPIDVPPAMYEDAERLLTNLPSPYSFAKGASPGQGGLPQIHADPRLNAIIIRDLASKMDAHERLIRALDIRPRMIELHLRIIDAETAVIPEIALERVQPIEPIRPLKSKPELKPTGRPDTSFEAGPYNEAPLPKNPYTSIVRGTPDSILPQLRNGDGRVRIVSEPRVIALDNVVAELGNTKTFYARGAGASEGDGNALRIEAGTRLRIQPQAIVEPDGSKRIQLSVTLMDGGFTGQGEQELPMVASHTLNTIAVVRAGESLLIGGLSYDFERGLANPASGDGRPTTPAQTARSERLYLITPRIIEE
jgi:type III secretion protein C